MTVVIGTAGHIDHGKTTLLRALTGIDADRLPEERRRGMTIDVGYAHLAFPDGTPLDFVDVPGHDRLIGNMLVGAGEIDAVLLVVAADDGPRAQTAEHVELLDALGLTEAVVAISKADLVEPERIDEVRVAVRRLLAPTAFAGAPVLAVSGATGEGIEALREALRAMARRVTEVAPATEVAPVAVSAPVALGASLPPTSSRLAIDRVFSIRGRGVVVTGTLRGAPIARGDRLVVEPGSRRVRVREVQVHGDAVDRAMSGRAALNLAGIDAGDLRRGQVVGTPGAVEVADRLLVVLRGASSGGGLPADRARIRLHAGTDQVDARLGRAGREAVDLGDGRATAILRLERPMAIARGDRFVLRRPSPGSTAAGGIVLDPAPPRGVGRRRATRERLTALDEAVRRGEGDVERLSLHGVLAAGGRPPRLAPDVEMALSEAAIDAITTAPDAGPTLPALRAILVHQLRRAVAVDATVAAAVATTVIDGLVAGGRLARSGDRVHRPGATPVGPSPAILAAMDRLVAALDKPAPPPLDEVAQRVGCPPDAVRALEREGRIVVLGPGLAWAAPAWERLARLALERAASEPLTPAALRDATGTSRKYVMALLEDLDRRGILARTPDGHVPGPRSATLRGAPGSAARAVAVP